MKWKDRLFELTPLGNADLRVRKHLSDDTDTDQFEKYKRALDQYRRLKLLQTFLKALLYASIITSIAATLGLPQAQILQKIASYVGTSLLVVLYVTISYLTMIRRESYHVQREILISEKK